MHDFLMKILSETDIPKELESIGFDKSYIHKAKGKFEYLNFKIYDLSCAQANIIKQTALSVGSDCATHKDVITGKADVSSVLLGGSVSQLLKIAQKLQLQPFNLKTLGLQLENCVNQNVSSDTKIVGILNITQDSFSDGGLYLDKNAAIEHLNSLIEDGADIIDIGAESTKPYSKPVDPDLQLARILPILEYVSGSNINIPISIDTRSAKVALECIKNGASIINDVSGLDYDEKMADVLAGNKNIKLIIQHSKGTPETMQDSPVYVNLMDEIYKSLCSKVEYAVSNGVLKDNIIVDPGIGFGKSKHDNFEIIKRWKELKTIGCPVMIGLSRKSLLGLNDSPNEEKDLYTLGLDTILIYDKVDYLRVHNVKMHRKMLEILGL